MANATIPGGGGGKIKSVGLTMPGEFSVANSPLTASGTLAVTKVNQNANLVYAGPTSGIAAQPTFRSIVAADLPAGIGTVTSVGLSTNAAWLTVGSSPITGAGTITLNSTTGLTANQVLATPNGGTGAVSLRALVAADIPSLPASQITSGQLALARGGTNADLSATGAANSFLKQSSSGAAITVGTIASADINTALTTPGPIGTTPNTGAFTTLGGTIITASTRFVGPIWSATTNGTTGQKITKQDGTTSFVLLDSTNSRMGVGASTAAPQFTLDVDGIVAAGKVNGSGEVRSYQNPSDGTFYVALKSIASDGAAGLYRSNTTYFVYYNLSTGGTHLNASFAGSNLVFESQAVSRTTMSPSGIWTMTVTDAVTAAVTNALVVDHSTSGTPAAGYGTGVLIRGQSSTTVSQSMTDIQASWAEATHASRKSRVIHNVYDTAAREALRFEASGSAPMIGFLGAAAVVRQTDGNNLTNNVTSGGTTAQIDDFTSLTLYATDAAAIRNDIYQLARMLKICNDALRLYGLLT